MMESNNDHSFVASPFGNQFGADQNFQSSGSGQNSFQRQAELYSNFKFLQKNF